MASKRNRSEYFKEYRRKNKDRYNEYQKEYQRKRRSELKELKLKLLELESGKGEENE